MSLSLTQNYTAIVPGRSAYFLALGGVAPYTYSVIAGGAGGSINSSSGAYTAPPTMTAYPASSLYDTIQVIDAMSATATAQILVGTAIFLFCEVIQNQMGLANGRVYVWDQKIFQPTDSGLYVAVSVMSPKPISNIVEYDGSGSGLNSVQTVNMYAIVDIDIFSRGPAARDQKELVIAALNSVYAQQQQEANSFYIGKISTNFINLSHVDGAAIPYRFKISVALQYMVKKILAVPYFDNFNGPQTNTNS